MELDLPQTEIWERNQDSCLSFDYPTPQIVIIKSQCREIRKVTLIRTGIFDSDGTPLLDIQRPKQP